MKGPRPRHLLIGLLGLAAIGGAIVLFGGSDDTPGGSRPATSETETPAGDDRGEADDQSGDLDTVAVELEEVVTFDEPIASALRLGDDEDTVYVAERAGLVWLLKGQDKIGPLLDIADDTVASGERGLLGMAMSPDGDFIYLHYTDTEGSSHVDEYSLSDDGTIDRTSRRTVLEVAQPFANHNGGHLAFGPDGFLHIALGDGGSGGDPEGNGQDPTTLLGSILRIDPTDNSEGPYAIPDDNPFATGEGGAPEVYVFGLRNPWRFDFDDRTGDLWIADVGQNELEEISRLPADEQAGANLGWNVFEGTSVFDGPPVEGTVAPVFEYGRDEGQSITGGVLYRGEAIDGLDGAYLFADFYVGDLRALTLAGDGTLASERSLDVVVPNLAHFAETADGEVLLFSLDGPVFRLVPA